MNGGAIGDVAAAGCPETRLTCNTTTTGAFGAQQNGVNDCSGYPFMDLDNGNFAYASGGEGSGIPEWRWKRRRRFGEPRPCHLVLRDCEQLGSVDQHRSLHQWRAE